MNEETRKLIESLAASLGTTAEHLWQVLLRQAYISFWTDLLFYTITAVGVWFTAKCSAKFRSLAAEDATRSCPAGAELVSAMPASPLRVS